MLSASILILAGLAWLGLLFGVGIAGERARQRGGRMWPIAFALSLAVYCTAWTFYGTVTQAARSNWPVPPTFVGSVLFYVFGWRLLVRVVELAKANNSTSIADFIASRFGKSSWLAAVVTAVAVLGTVPYLALQLKAAAMAFAAVGGASTEPATAWQDAALWIAVAMAAFAMLFGTRRAAASEHNPGLVLALGFESLLKLAAMLALGIFALWLLLNTPREIEIPAAQLFDPGPMRDHGSFLSLILLGALAMLALPHQFHIGVIECRGPADLRAARWVFPLYLGLIALTILPLARAGTLLLAPQGIASDLYVLALPRTQDSDALALLAYLGGLSAASGMVILAAITLAVMVSNHWLAPLLIGRGWARSTGFGSRLLGMRRLGIAVVLALAYGYSRLLQGSEALADIGSLSFSGLAQLAPAVIAAVWRPQWSARAVMAGLLAGALLWCWTLLLPVLAPQFGLQPALAALAQSSFHFLSPEHALGLGALDPLSRGVLLSLGANVLAMMLVARLDAQPRSERQSPALGRALIEEIAQRFLSPERIARVLDASRDAHSRERSLEHELSAVLGAASARLLLDAARRDAPASLETVAELVDQAAARARFSQVVLESALENLSQGICVADADLRLVAWNRRYAEIFDYPPGLLEVGRSVEDLMRHNLERGMLDASHADAAIARRLSFMRAGSSHLAERLWPDGSIIEIRGNPMPGGGFVATFTDVTAFRKAAAELKLANETLELRVDARTRELVEAKRRAEQADAAKSRFLAAVSHDLVQPLHAAHLFTWALGQRLSGTPYADSVGQIDSALGATENLLGGLLDISRLDAGGLTPRRARFAVREVLEPLAREFEVLAAETGLVFRARLSRAWVDSDPLLLRRILQNFLANAVRYTARGRVLLGVRKRRGSLSLQVWDTGPGFDGQEAELIFEEFRRLRPRSGGLGLGLAIAARMAGLLGHRIEVRSRPGQGSLFAIEVPAVAAERTPGARQRGESRLANDLQVLVVDNDLSVSAGMRALLEEWGCAVDVAQGPVQALEMAKARAPDVALVDFHLDESDGIALINSLRERDPRLAVVLISADHSPDLAARAAAMGLPLLYKPLRPLKLRALLSRVKSRGGGSGGI